MRNILDNRFMLYGIFEFIHYIICVTESHFCHSENNLFNNSKIAHFSFKINIIPQRSIVMRSYTGNENAHEQWYSSSVTPTSESSSACWRAACNTVVASWRILSAGSTLFSSFMSFIANAYFHAFVYWLSIVGLHIYALKFLCDKTDFKIFIVYFNNG